MTNTFPLGDVILVAAWPSQWTSILLVWAQTRSTARVTVSAPVSLKKVRRSMCGAPLGFEPLVEVGQAALPGIGGGGGVVRGTVVGEEAVARAWVGHDLDILVVLLEQVAQLARVGRRRALVRLPVKPEERRLDVLGHVEPRHRVGLIRVRARGRPVPGHGGLDVGIGRSNLVDGRAAPAPAGHADAVGPHTRPLLGPVVRGRDVTQHLLAGHREHDLQDGLDVRNMTHAALTLEQLRRHGVVTLLGEAPRAVLDPLMDPPDLADDEDDGVVASRRRAGLVDRHAVVADLDLEVSGRQSIGMRLDDPGEDGVGGQRIAGEGRAADLEHLASRQTRGSGLGHFGLLLVRDGVTRVLNRGGSLSHPTRARKARARSVTSARALLRSHPFAAMLRRWPTSPTSFPGLARGTMSSRSAGAATTTTTTAPGAAGTPLPTRPRAPSTCSSSSARARCGPGGWFTRPSSGRCWRSATATRSPKSRSSMIPCVRCARSGRAHATTCTGSVRSGRGSSSTSTRCRSRTASGRRSGITSSAASGTSTACRSWPRSSAHPPNAVS